MLKCTGKILRLIIAENRERSVYLTAVAKGFKDAEGTGPREEWEVDRNEERDGPTQGEQESRVQTITAHLL